VFYMKKSSKYWLWGSIIIIIINLIVFSFRNYVTQTFLFWVVILTPVTFLALYPLTRLLDREGTSRHEKGR
jgi:hypothetical protein